MSLLGYRAYKESGAVWPERVPTTWNMTPLKHVANFVNGCVFKPDSWRESGTPIIRIENLNGSLSFNFYDGEVDARHHVSKNDLLFGWSGNRGTSFGPFIWGATGHYFLNQHIFKVQSLGSSDRWLFWALRAVTAQVEDQATGIIGMVHVTKGDLGAIRVPVPPPLEQLAIAVFLDRETAKIDALIAEQKKLIALLAEKRQATISHAVTRGLDPDAPMKDSGVAWLGEVPTHWRLRPLKHLVRLRSGGTPSKENRAFWDGEVPWASAKDLKSERLSDTVDHLTEDALALGAAELIPAGATVVVVRGMILARLFPVTQIMAPMAINQDLKAVLANDLVLKDYLPWLLRGSAEESLCRLDEAGHGTKALRMDAWTSMLLPVPPLDEQEELLRHFNEKGNQLDRLSVEAIRAVELLKERRAALIAAAVTGQIKVFAD